MRLQPRNSCTQSLAQLWEFLDVPSWCNKTGGRWMLVESNDFGDWITQTPGHLGTCQVAQWQENYQHQVCLWYSERKQRESDLAKSKVGGESIQSKSRDGLHWWFLPVTKGSTVQIIFALAVPDKWCNAVTDVKNAFVNVPLKKTSTSHSKRALRWVVKRTWWITVIMRCRVYRRHHGRDTDFWMTHWWNWRFRTPKQIRCSTSRMKMII